MFQSFLRPDLGMSKPESIGCSIGNQKKRLSASLCQDLIVTHFWFRKKHETSRLWTSNWSHAEFHSKLAAFTRDNCQLF